MDMKVTATPAANHHFLEPPTLWILAWMHVHLTRAQGGPNPTPPPTPTILWILGPLTPLTLKKHELLQDAPRGPNPLPSPPSRLAPCRDAYMLSCKPEEAPTPHPLYPPTPNSMDFSDVFRVSPTKPQPLNCLKNGCCRQAGSGCCGVMFQTCSTFTRVGAPPHRSASSRSRNGIQTLGIGVRPPVHRSTVCFNQQTRHWSACL